MLTADEQPRACAPETEFETVCRQFGDSLFRLACSYESAPDVRDDLLQEIRLALWKALPGFRGECSLRTFVYRVAHNRGLSHVWRRRQQARFTDDLPDVGDPQPTAESAAIGRDRLASLMQAIRRLPIPYRQVITMTLDELPQSEIANVLGISENNVAVRLNRARKLLREALGGK
jgi:RNA polymerase sigma-70 factor (ECF subfamily)